MIALRRFAARTSFVLGLVPLLAGARDSKAKSIAANARGHHWVGWWRQEEALTPPLVCVVATAGANADDVGTGDSGKVVPRYTVDATGREHAVNRDGCIGSERA